MAWVRGKWVPDPVTTAAPPVAVTAVADPRTSERAADEAARAAARAARPPRSTTPGSPAVPAPPAAPPGLLEPAPTYADASVENRLTGLLDANSSYIQMARKGGVRTAARRGLLNSSIAAGSGEAAAIAAAAPIASQDAAQIHSSNQAKLEGHINYNNQTRLQGQQDLAAMERQRAQITSAEKMQQADLKAAMDRLGIQVATEKEIATNNNTTALTQSQINANADLVGNYMQAFATMAGNPDIPAATREAYIREMKMVVSQGQGLTNSLAGKTVTWGPTPTTGTPTTPAPASGSTSGIGARLAA